MKYKTLLVEIRHGIGIVWLNRPKVNNALDETMIFELTATLRTLEADPAVRIVILAGLGPCFCAGGDIHRMKRMADLDFAQNQADAMKLVLLLQVIDTFKKPIIARVHGLAFGAGVGIIAACDMAVGAYEAEFCLSEVRLGLFPSAITPYVIRAIGERASRRYLLSAERFTAAEAYRIGLLSDIAPMDELDERINELLGQLIQGGPGAQTLAKDWIRTVAAAPITDGLSSESATRVAAARASAEGREGILAFLEKRVPAWLAQTTQTAKKTTASKTKPGPKATAKPVRNKLGVKVKPAQRKPKK
jgi:methylglutaconyl-CoA hydratase